MRRGWDILLGADLALLAVLSVASFLVDPPKELVDGTPPPSAGVTQASLWADGAVILVLMGIVPLVWAFGKHGKGAWDRLRLRRPDYVFLGIGGGFVLLVAMAIIVALVQQMGVPTENPVAQEIGRTLTWPLAVFLGVASGFGEEILFRGVLMPILGLWGQAVLFGLLHFSYGTPLQIVLTFLLGLAFGLATKKWGLWVAIGAHFTFNFVQFVAAILIQR